MPAGDLITADRQMEVWRSDTDRLLIGDTTYYRFENINGLTTPAVRAERSPRPQGHGVIALGNDFYDSRSIEGEISVLGLAGAELSDRLNVLSKAFRVLRRGEANPTLTYRGKGTPARRLTGRPKGAEWPGDWRHVKGRGVPAGFRFEALDPRFYSTTEFSQTITIAAGSSSNSATIANAGDTESSPILEIQGPAVNPRISNGADANRQVKIDITLTALETLIVDVGAKTATLAGVDKYGSVRTDNQWFDIIPGNNLITFSRTGTTGAAVLTVKWRDAYSTIGPST